MIYLLIAIFLLILLYQIKVNVILYNKLELIDTYRLIPLCSAIAIFLNNYQFLSVDIFFRVNKYLDKLNSFQNK